MECIATREQYIAIYDDRAMQSLLIPSQPIGEPDCLDVIIEKRAL